MLFYKNSDMCHAIEEYVRNPHSRNDRMHDRNSYRKSGYSRDDGKEEYLENLRDMMHNAPDENTRQSIQRMINQMSQM